MYDMLKMKNQWSQVRAIEFASRLIQTASKSLSEQAASNLVAQEMRRIGYDKVVQDSAGNVVGVMLGIQAGPTLLLNSHLDTVEWKKDDWTHDPLCGEVIDGKLYGIGAADCKGGLAAQVYVGELLKRSMLPLKGNLIVSATVAEQNGRGLGIRTMMEQTLPEMELKPDYAVLGEPTGLGLYHGHDGWMEVEISVRGANPFHVDDATGSIARNLNNGGSSPGQFAWTTDQPRFHDTPGGRMSVIQANRRLTSSESADDVIRQLKHEAQLVVNGSGSVAVEVAICQEPQQMYTGKTTLVRQLVNSWSTDPFSPLVERSRQSLSAGGCEVRPGKWELGRAGMGTAGGVLVKDFGLPTIGYGPGTEDQAHAVDEHVKTEMLGQAIYGTALIAHGLIGVPVFGWTNDEI
jgi:acetylornithine deacetylase/succinyl-diaminopimelate desuccinylase-like protein